VVVQVHGIGVVGIRTRRAFLRRERGTGVLVFPLDDRCRCGRSTDALASFFARVSFACETPELIVATTIDLPLIMILNHDLRLGAHVSGDGVEIGAEMRDVTLEICLLGNGPIAVSTGFA
jgi:hypothetical protein